MNGSFTEGCVFMTLYSIIEMQATKSWVLYVIWCKDRPSVIYIYCQKECFFLLFVLSDVIQAKNY